MTEAAQMFQPLSPEKLEAAVEVDTGQERKPVPISPVQQDAPPTQFRHSNTIGPIAEGISGRSA